MSEKGARKVQGYSPHFGFSVSVICIFENRGFVNFEISLLIIPPKGDTSGGGGGRIEKGGRRNHATGRRTEVPSRRLTRSRYGFHKTIKTAETYCFRSLSFFSQIESPRIRNRQKRERTDDHSFSRNLVSAKVALFSVRVWPSRHSS